MNAVLRTALVVAGATLATQALAQITFYARPGYEGQSFTTQRQVGNFERFGFSYADFKFERGWHKDVCVEAEELFTANFASAFVTCDRTGLGDVFAKLVRVDTFEVRNVTTRVADADDDGAALR